MVAKAYTLRERKYARTKIAIMNSFIQQLSHSRFDNISIKQICKDVDVAEGTFFNYFPEKIDVISYYLSLTTLKMIYEAKKQVPAGKYLSLIDLVFRRLSEGWNNDNLIYQIISVLLSQGGRSKTLDISGIEKKIAFPDRSDIEKVPSVMLHEWFKECLILAQKNGELPSRVNIDDATISLMTIVFGTMLAIRFSNKNKSTYHYMRQLRILWRDLGAKDYANR
ncbi:MAG: TetR/AcrR family transcriptional regulator [Candidatus Omnitrophica bacterium]|nr:TetR/AcrR family transcriptional regulator [Candidatus Omnitrophota bacterium]